MTAEGDVTVTSVSIDTPAVSEEICDCQHLIGTLHRDSDVTKLDMTKFVVVEESDVDESPIIVAYRRRVSETGAMLPLTGDDEYPNQIQNIVQDIVQNITEQSIRVPKKAAKKAAHQLIAFGVHVRPTPDNPKPDID